MASIAQDKEAKKAELEAKLAKAKVSEEAAVKALEEATAAGKDAAEIKALNKVLKKAKKEVAFAQKGLKKLNKVKFNVLLAVVRKPKEGGEEKVKEAFVNKTLKGEKKDLSGPMESYNPAAVEAAWGDWWEAKGFLPCKCGKRRAP